MLERWVSLPASLATPDGERLSLRAYLFLALLCLAFFTSGFATMPPTDRDGASFAQASKQMVESGDYIDIHFQDEDRFRKPVGIYWLQALSARLFLDHHDLNRIWAYRVPSLIGASVAVLMTAATGALLFGPATGLLAAIMMAGCAILNAEARIATTDAALLGAVMTGQYALARAYLGQGRARLGWGVPLAFWTALGAGILLKGPIILLVVASTLLWLRVSEGNIKWFAVLRPWLGVPYALLLVAPWFVTIMLASHGHFFEQSAVHDLFDKLWQGQNRGIMPPGLYLLAFPLAFFPFALWPLLAIPDSWRARQEPGVRFCLGWLIPAWLVFELSLTKLPHYVMPLYPAIALLAARALGEGYPALAERRWRWLPPLAMSLWLMAGAFYAFALVLVFHFFNEAWNAGLIAAALLLLIAQGASLFLLLQRKEGSVLAMAMGGLIFFTGFFGGALPNLQHVWMSKEIIRTAESIKPCPGPLRLTSSYIEPSLVFLNGTNTTRAWQTGGWIAYDLRADSCRVGVVDDGTFGQFMDAIKTEPVTPRLVVQTRGFDIARGGWHTIRFYLLPQKAKTP